MEFSVGYSVADATDRVVLSAFNSSPTRRYDRKTRAFFGSIPEEFGNRGESTITKLPMRNKRWQKHHKKDLTTVNRMTVGGGLYEVGTAVWPREFYHRNFLLKKSGKKFPLAIMRFLLRQQKKKERNHSIRRGLVFLIKTISLD